MTNQQKALETKLKKAGLAYLEMNIFGSINTNINIKVKGKKSADSWYMLLNKFASKVNMVESVVYGKDSTPNEPVIINCYLIGAKI